MHPVPRQTSSARKLGKLSESRRNLQRENVGAYRGEATEEMGIRSDFFLSTEFYFRVFE